MSQHVSTREKVAALDRFCQKMINSGHCLAVVRRTMVSGITGHIRKVTRCMEEGKPFHRTAASSARSGKLKKLTAKQSWFKNKPECEDKSKDRDKNFDMGTGGKRGKGHGRGGSGGNKIAVIHGAARTSITNSQPTTVLFCEYSRGGDLQSKLKGVADRLAPLVGFKMRVTERGGTKLSSLLSNKNLWSGMECGRKECAVCRQTGDKKEDCVRHNILYESECSKCGEDVDVTVTGASLERQGKEASLYVGETARSLFERSSEHWQAAEQKKEESHMFQHCEESHKGESNPTFKFRVVRGFKSALDRQIAEAFRIEMS